MVKVFELQLNLEADKYAAMRDMPAHMNLLVAHGVRQEEWYQIHSEIDEVRKAGPCYNQPFCECLYFCVPGGPVQCLLCMCNPITCCMYDKQEKRKRVAGNRTPELKLLLLW